MPNSDSVRWKQRFTNFKKALDQLESGCDKEEYSDLECAGLAQMFQFSFELTWKTLKDLLYYEGFEVKTPRSVIKTAFGGGYLSESETETLLDALDKRNLLSHTCSEETAHKAQKLIKNHYLSVLQHLRTDMNDITSHGTSGIRQLTRFHSTCSRF